MLKFNYYCWNDYYCFNFNSFYSSPFFHQLLCLVGEAFDDYSDDVCGAVVNIRSKGDKIAVWTSDYENRDAVTHIGWGRFSLFDVKYLHSWNRWWHSVHPLAVSFSCQQESLQGALGASHEDDYWLPVSLRHSHQKRFNHQEQICCLRNALCSSFISLSYLLLVHNVYFAAKTLRNAIWKTNQSKTTCQMFP